MERVLKTTNDDEDDVTVVGGKLNLKSYIKFETAHRAVGNGRIAILPSCLENTCKEEPLYKRKYKNSKKGQRKLMIKSLDSFDKGIVPTSENSWDNLEVELNKSVPTPTDLKAETTRGANQDVFVREELEAQEDILSQALSFINLGNSLASDTEGCEKTDQTLNNSLEPEYDQEIKEIDDSSSVRVISPQELEKDNESESEEEEECEEEKISSSESSEEDDPNTVHVQPEEITIYSSSEEEDSVHNVSDKIIHTQEDCEETADLENNHNVNQTLSNENSDIDKATENFQDGLNLNYQTVHNGYQTVEEVQHVCQTVENDPNYQTVEDEEVHLGCETVEVEGSFELDCQTEEVGQNQTVQVEDVNLNCQTEEVGQNQTVQVEDVNLNCQTALREFVNFDYQTTENLNLDYEIVDLTSREFHDNPETNPETIQENLGYNLACESFQSAFISENLEQNLQDAFISETVEENLPVNNIVEEAVPADTVEKESSQDCSIPDTITIEERINSDSNNEHFQDVPNPDNLEENLTSCLTQLTLYIPKEKDGSCSGNSRTNNPDSDLPTSPGSPPLDYLENSRPKNFVSNLPKKLDFSDNNKIAKKPKVINLSSSEELCSINTLVDLSLCNFNFSLNTEKLNFLSNTVSSCGPSQQLNKNPFDFKKSQVQPLASIPKKTKKKKLKHKSFKERKFAQEMDPNAELEGEGSLITKKVILRKFQCNICFRHDFNLEENFIRHFNEVHKIPIEFMYRAESCSEDEEVDVQKDVDRYEKFYGHSIPGRVFLASTETQEKNSDSQREDCSSSEREEDSSAAKESDTDTTSNQSESDPEYVGDDDSVDSDYDPRATRSWKKRSTRDASISANKSNNTETIVNAAITSVQTPFTIGAQSSPFKRRGRPPNSTKYRRAIKS